MGAAALTAWARQWWEEARIEVNREKGQDEYILFKEDRTGAAAIGLGIGLLDARLGLHALIHSHLHRGDIGPDS